MVQKIISLILFLLLAVQLVLLQPRVLSLADYSVGELSLVAEEVSSYSKKIITEATLSGVRAKEHDSIVFVGDVMLGRHVETLMNRSDSSYPYTDFLLQELSATPAVVANFEASASAFHVQAPANTMRFSVDEKHLGAFSENFDFASLANNHSLDFQEEGYLNARTLLEQRGVSVFGHNARIDKDSITYLETQRGKIALIGVNASQRIPEEAEITSVCSLAKRQSDFQVVYIHWGDEYNQMHSETQRLLAEVFIDSCADLIVGHHPHVVQDVDLIKGVPVFYSLGNYIFDQYFSAQVREGLVVALTFEGAPALELSPISSKEKKSVPGPMDLQEKQMFLDDLATRSHPSLKSAISAGRISLLEPVATSTKMAIMWR